MWDLLWHYTMECLRLIAQTICGYSTFLSEDWQMRTLSEARIRVEGSGRVGTLHNVINVPIVAHWMVHKDKPLSSLVMSPTSLGCAYGSL